MIRDKEQPLNPPGWDAPERKIKRQYVPMREYIDIEANGERFDCVAEVEACGEHDENIKVSRFRVIWHMCLDARHGVHGKYLDSYISRSGPTWRELIEREICRQAGELPGTAWEIEYEGDDL